MNSNENITRIQMIYISANFLLGPSLLILTGIKYAKKDVFICDIIGLFAGILLTFMMCYVTDRFPDMEYTKILNSIFSPIGGRIIASMYLIYSICLIGLVESNVSGMVTTMVMPSTPQWIIVLTATLLAAYLLNSGVETFSLNVEILLPSIIFLNGFIYIVLFLQYGDINNLLPVFTESTNNIVKGTIEVVSFPYIDSCILIFIYSVSKENFKKRKLIKSIYLLVGFFLITRSIIVISVLGTEEATRFTYSLFNAVRLIEIGNYIERLELLLLAAWLSSTFIKLATCYYVILKCIEYIFNLKDYKSISFSLVILIIPLSLNVFSSATDITQNVTATILTLKAPILAVTLMVFIRSLFFSKKLPAGKGI